MKSYMIVLIIILAMTSALIADKYNAQSMNNAGAENNNINSEKENLMGIISGMVYEYGTGESLKGVQVNWGDYMTMTKDNGYFMLEVGSGMENLKFNLPGYSDHVIMNVEMKPGSEYMADVKMKALYLPPVELHSKIMDRDVILSWSAPQGAVPDSYKLYRDGMMLTNTKEFKYHDMDLPDGTYMYYATAIYGGMESDPTAKMEVMILVEDNNEAPAFISDEKELMSMNEPGSENNNINSEKDMFMGTIAGMVYEYGSGEALQDVQVNWGEYMTMTKDNGYFWLEVGSGMENLKFNLPGYSDYVIMNVEMKPGLDYMAEVKMKALYLPPMELHSKIMDRDVILSWSAPEGAVPDSYKLYRDGMMLTNTKELKYQDMDLSDGTYMYYVTALYGRMESDPTAKLEVMISEGDHDGEEALTAVKIKGNYPNPFNPTTKINFALSEPQQVKLEIFNVRGQKVNTLVNEQLPASDHSITWNGDNESGGQVPSGVYFYRLQTSGFSEMRKMNLLK